MSDLNWHKLILKSPFRNSEVRGPQGMVQIKYLKEYFLLSLRVRLYVWVGGWFYVCLSMPYCVRIVYFNDDVYCSNVKKIRICLTFNKFLQRTLPSGWKSSKLQFLNCNSFRWCRIRNNQNENKQKNRK